VVFASRLASALFEELRLLSQVAPGATLNHLEGNKNVTADYLSRLLERPVGESTFYGLLRQLNTSPDPILQIQDEGEEWWEVVTRDCRNFEELIRIIEIVCTTFHPAKDWSFEELTVVLVYLCQKRGMSPMAKKGNYIQVEKFQKTIWVNQQVLFDGTILDRMVVPSCSRNKAVVKLLVKFFHVQGEHRGYRHDIARINNSWFFIEGVTNIYTRV
jgi:hypothetical protein